jgi:K(+)-stimulated pyrophosphate-energized sodium pump
MFNIFLVVFFSTLAFAFVEPYFFIGYLISTLLAKHNIKERKK